MTKEIKQLSFGDLEDNRPLPLILAETRGFALQHHVQRGIYLYSIQDWIAGVSTSKNARQVWADIKRRYPENELLESVVQLPYTASNGKVYQMDFATDKGLYLITQKMNMDTALRDEILNYLAKAGSTLDDWRRHPEKMLSAAQARMAKTIERHEKAGLGERDEIVLLKARYENVMGGEALRKTIAQICDNPNYAHITNAEYLALFGMVAKELKPLLNTKSIRDVLGIHQLRMLTLAEGILEEMLKKNRNQELSNEMVIEIVNVAIRPVGAYLRDVANMLGVHHVTGKPLLQDRTS